MSTDSPVTIRLTGGGTVNVVPLIMRALQDDGWAIEEAVLTVVRATTTARVAGLDSARPGHPGATP